MSDSVVLVTGGAGNIGRTVTAAVLASGARVAVPLHKGDRPDALDALKAQYGQKLNFFALDLTTERGAKAAVDGTVEWAGRLDGVVHLVGAYAGGMRLDATPVEVWDRMMEVNVRSAFLVGRAALRQLLKQGGGGALVFVSARAAVEKPAQMAAYAASKQALLTMVEAMAAEYVEQRIRANVLLPGTVDTQANRAAMPGADPSQWTSPEMIAQTVVSLLDGDATAERVLL
ncbi:MAG TPA: SDR family NAD(P)-dependent oxidoreductase [Longimicrobiaceae bacterium]|jgi:NAD(P)-dependent dehydrogenase (short-subunit alcohol dehydrogenase family)|nr:SDR family NAD(P)-dependent oxidoreductase [Longimicrobiaceae bacterium]